VELPYVEYDSLKRMTGLRDPDLGNWTYRFDASNNLVNQTDARGKLIKFEYDLLNRPTKKDYPSDTDTTFTYDTGKIGTLYQADSASGTVKYEYDSRLRQTAENYTRGSTLYWIRQSYDDMDRVVNKSFSSGETLSYTFNSGGMLGSPTILRIVFIHVFACIYTMVRMTFAITDELKKRLDARKDINWSEVFKEGVERRLEALEKMHGKGMV